ncbi:ferredoxin [Geomonas oryzisoli]|uniref:Ferredoxin n=1 Tax=Geomonas oryzisoli TaxID=2847992 RepID=A0ABX8J6P1_9BACT|nr:ferredoxin [Geomonas oryzisoli]QWV92397.1 ferredoxin [Geomonas oryzisoli]
MPSQVYVDQQICIGCGLCVSILPDLFRLNGDGVSEVYVQRGGDREKIQKAIDSCPVNCIAWR